MNQQNQRKNDSPETRTRVVSLILLLGLGVLVGWVLWSPEKSQETSALTDDRSQETLSPQASQVSPTPASQNRGITDFSLREGQEAVIPLADIPAERPLLLNLELADEAGSDFGIKSAWIYQESRDPLELRAVRTGPNRFRAELPGASLAPGRAIVELRTDENSPLALRRFAVQIR